MTTVRQFRFSYGKLAKTLWSAVDQNAYALGLRGFRNGIVGRAGDASTRAGTIFRGETYDPTKASRLLPFVFSPDPDQAYFLEFTDLVMRVVRNGDYVTEASKSITAATKASPCALTVTAHGYTTGDRVIIARGSVVGMKQLNGRQYIVTSTGANTITLASVDGTAVNSTGFSTYVSGGSIAKVYKIATPYVEADLMRLYIDQTADVVTIACAGYAPRELVRTGHAAWTLSIISFGGLSSFIQATAVRGAAGSNSYRYRISVEDPTGFYGTEGPADSGSIGTPNWGLEDRRTITAITAANPAVVSITAHGYSNGDEVTLNGMSGMAAPFGGARLNDRRFVIAGVTANTFQLVGQDTTGWSAYGGSGFGSRTYARVDAAAAGTAAAPILISWLATYIVPMRYKVYKEFGGVYGFIGYIDVPAVTGLPFPTVTFSDIGFSPDLSLTPPIQNIVFGATGDYPGVVASYQDRKVYARSDNDPEQMRASRIDDFHNFSTHTQLVDDDAIKTRVTGGQVTEIKHLIDMQRLVILTSGSEKVANGDSAGTLTPTQINVKTYSYNGASGVKPVLVDNVIVFVQEGGQRLLGMTFDEFGRHESIDLSKYTDLLEGKTIIDMAYQKTPDSIIWLALDDGTLLSLTFLPELGILAWAEHDVDGDVESVCCIPGGDGYVLGMVVQRTLPSGASKRYIETLAQKYDADIKDFIGSDSCRSFDGRHRADANTMRLQGGTTWAAGESMTAHASGGTQFHADDVGSAVFIYGSEAVHGVDILIRCTITAYVDATNVTVTPNIAVPAGLRTVYTSNWDLAALTVYEMWHLEGETLSVLKDGDVYASPNNDQVAGVATVTNGAIVLTAPGGMISAGLPYLADIETLNIDTVQGEPLIGKKKHLKSIYVYVKESWPFWAGPRPPTDDTDDPLEGLEENSAEDQLAELEENSPESIHTGLDEPLPGLSDVAKVRIPSLWNNNGRVFIRNVDPRPLNIIAIAPSGVIAPRG